MTDPAEIRAEGRRLLDEYRRVTESPRDYYARLAAGSEWSKWVLAHADALLADPAPVGLTENEQMVLASYRRPGNNTVRPLLAIIDRLSAAPRAEREALERSKEALIRKVKRLEDRVAILTRERDALGAARDALAAPAEED